MSRTIAILNCLKMKHKVWIRAIYWAGGRHTKILFLIWPEKKYLCVPSSSASSERAFRTAGRIVEDVELVSIP